MGEGSHVQPGPQKKRIGSAEMLASAGFACFFAWFLFAFFGVNALFPASVPHVTRLVLHGVGFVCIALLAWVLHSRAIRVVDMTCKVAFLAAVVACGALAALPFLLQEFCELPVWCYACGFAPAAFCAMVFLVSWEDACSRIEECRCLRYMCFSLGGGVVVFELLRYLVPAPGIWAFAVLLLAASASMLYAVQDSYKVEQDVLVASPDNPTLDRRIALLGFTVNFASAVAMPVFVFTEPEVAHILFGSMGVALLCLVYFLFNDTWRKQNTVTMHMRISATGIVIGLVAPLALPQGVQPLCFGLAGAAWLLYWVMVDTLLIQHARNIGIAGALYLAPSKIVSNGGFALGWLFGTALVVAAGRGPALLWGTAAIGLVSGLAIICVIPFLRAKGDPAQTDEGEVPKPLSMEAKLARLRQEFKLTPRELDVAGYALVGRNAQAISAKLFLSENTVRTHMYNIYKKTGVHSQQELMELAETALFDPLENV